MNPEHASIYGPYSRGFLPRSSSSVCLPAQYSDWSRNEHSCLFLLAVSLCASASCHIYAVPATRNSPVCCNAPEPCCTWYSYSLFSIFRIHRCQLPRRAVPILFACATFEHHLHSSPPYISMYSTDGLVCGLCSSTVTPCQRNISYCNRSPTTRTRGTNTNTNISIPLCFWPSYTLCTISSLSLAFSIIAPLSNLNVTLLLIVFESLSPDNSHHHQTALIPTIQRPGSLRIVQSMRILSFLLTN